MNSRPPVPQTGALTRLRHAPISAEDAGRRSIARDGHEQHVRRARTTCAAAKGNASGGREHRAQFQSWDQLLRTIAATAVTYLALIILLRIAGQRTLAKWYAFDLIVTVALGSTFANGVLSKDFTIAQALVGFVELIGL